MTSAIHQHQAPRLTAAQIGEFKRDGFLILPPGAVDKDLCVKLLDDSWHELTSVWVPRLRRDDPTTWGALAQGEGIVSERRGPNNSHPGGDPRFDGSGHRFYLKNGADERHLDLFPRALWPVVDQLFGTGNCVWPKGVGADGKISGPVFMDASTESGLATHCDTEPRWPAPLVTENFSCSPTGAGHINGQAGRGLYCTLPGSPDPRPPPGESSGGDVRTNTPGAKFWSGMHSDGGHDTRSRLRATLFLDDCPQGSGGFTLWKGSHGAMHDHQWKMTQTSNSQHAHKSAAQLQEEWDTHAQEGMNYRTNSERHANLDGYNSLAQDKLRQIEPLEIAGSAGTVVLWHAQLAHVIGQNSRSDTIRIASICDVWLTPEALPDVVLRKRRSTLVGEPFPSLWTDWSSEVQKTPTSADDAVVAVARL